LAEWKLITQRQKNVGFALDGITETQRYQPSDEFYALIDLLKVCYDGLESYALKHQCLKEMPTDFCQQKEGSQRHNKYGQDIRTRQKISTLRENDRSVNTAPTPPTRDQVMLNETGTANFSASSSVSKRQDSDQLGEMPNQVTKDQRKRQYYEKLMSAALSFNSSNKKQKKKL
jgi:hypothetical protein